MFADKLFNEIKFLLNSCHEQTPTFSPQENTPCRACVLKLLQIYTNQVVLLLLAWKRTRLMGPYICLQMPHMPRADSQRGLSSPSHSSARLIGRDGEALREPRTMISQVALREKLVMAPVFTCATPISASTV